MRIRRRDFLKSASAAAAASSLPMPAIGQGAFPNKPITLIVPWQASLTADLMLRGMAEIASKVLGQPIIVDNKPGASGTLGPATMAGTAKPDGYTIAQLPITVFRLPSMQKMSFDPLKDFTYIIHIAGYQFGTVCKADGPIKKWQDVIDMAKADPNKVTYATGGVSTSPHIGMELIAGHSGVKFTHVPMKGGSESIAAVLGGHVMLQAESPSWQASVDSGQMRLLKIWTEERHKRWPDVPTLKELGYPFVFDSPFGLGGPKGIDLEIVKKLHDAFKVAYDDPKSIEIYEKFNFARRYMNTADYVNFVPEMVASEKAAVEKLGLVKKD
jgi:tripartite-type tricarboxylate transporter receptor subunit TctC